MGSFNSYTDRQIAATNALILFLEQHDTYVPEELRQSRDAFSAGDVKRGCALAFRVRPFGNGALTDGSPPPKFEHETPSYCRVVQEASVRNWCFWISVADDGSTFWKKVIHTFGSFFRSTPLAGGEKKGRPMPEARFFDAA